MIEDITYAGLLLLIIYAADYAVFAKMTNVAEIARLTVGDDAEKQNYCPLTPLRVLLSLSAAVVFFFGELSQRPLSQILYVMAGIMAFVILAVTIASSTSRPVDGN